MADKEAYDYVLFIGIAFGVVGIILVEAFCVARYAINARDIAVPAGLLFLSLLMFGMLIRDYRAHLKAALFWWTIARIFIPHLAVGAALQHLHLLRVCNIPLALFILVPEYLTVKAFLGTLFG
jgi:hypothetical protein